MELLRLEAASADRTPCARTALRARPARRISDRARPQAPTARPTLGWGPPPRHPPLSSPSSERYATCPLQQDCDFGSTPAVFAVNERVKVPLNVDCPSDTVAVSATERTQL